MGSGGVRGLGARRTRAALLRAADAVGCSDDPADVVRAQFRAFAEVGVSRPASQRRSLRKAIGSSGVPKFGAGSALPFKPASPRADFGFTIRRR